MVTALRVFSGSEEELDSLEDLKDSFGMGDVSNCWAFPTIMALREGKLIGAIGRCPWYDMVIAGPNLVPNLFLYIKLVEAQEVFFKAAGVSKYWFWIDKENKPMVKIMNRVDGDLIHLEQDTEDYLWYSKEI